MTLVAVEARREDVLVCASVIFSSSNSVASPLSDDLLADLLHVEAASVVDLSDGRPRDERQGGSCPSPACRQPCLALRIIETVISGIAHHVGRRILDQLEHLAVGYGL